MSPQLNDGEFVFLSFDEAKYGDYQALKPVASFKEQEGLTLVVPKALADNSRLIYDGVFRYITLQVHSSLSAVGLTAAFSEKLTAHNISANVIAGYYHDHIFVSALDAENAMAALREFVL